MNFITEGTGKEGIKKMNGLLFVWEVLREDLAL